MIKILLISIFFISSSAYASICDEAYSVPFGTKEFEFLAEKCRELVVNEKNYKDQYTYSQIIPFIFFEKYENDLDLLAKGNATNEFIEVYKIEYVKYLSYVKLSAEQGYIKSQTSLGKLYYLEDNSFIIDKDILKEFLDINKSFYWLKKSADRGDAEAQYYLSILYKEKSNSEINFNNSFYWLTQSARNNYPSAISRIIDIFTSMKSTDSDIIAHSWFLYGLDLSETNKLPKSVINFQISNYDRIKKKYDRNISLSQEQINLSKKYLYEIVKGEYNDFGVPFSFKSTFGYE